MSQPKSGTPDRASPPTSASAASTSASPYITFPNGNFILKSSDGHFFRVDYAVLKRASTSFHPFSHLASSGSEPVERALIMEESGEMLDILIKLLHPIENPPPPLTAQQSEAFFRMVDKLGVSSYAAHRFIGDYASSCTPIKGWAISTRFKLAESKRLCAKRYILAKNEEDASDYAELHHVTGHSVMKLLQVKRQVVSRARTAASNGVQWACKQHKDLPSVKAFDELLRTNPFDESSWSEDVLESIARSNQCADCTAQCPANVQQRNGLRAELRKMLETAVAQV
ncbi:hypothetical protein DL93DRAFT_2160056 [Clavulina sp. PMI_390]|nr:hypothetical protein DL93DRAFT_2160056 [Clavulina sp. PMI_390]